MLKAFTAKKEVHRVVKVGFLLLALLFVVAAVVPMLGIFPLDAIKDEVVNMLSTPFSMENQLGLCIYILLKNTLALLVIAFLSAPLIGIPLVMFILTNGVIMGVVLFDAVQSNIPVAVLVGGLLPHGVFELTAVAIALGLGYRQAGKFLGSIKFKNIRPDSLSLRLFGTVIMPLLVVAAVVETWITPLVMWKIMEIVI
ncbi:MAG TPA: stage II sporulation protein M [Clostridia bacterium]|nr:stage II sporulation protein M [Clostridia bacterium]